MSTNNAISGLNLWQRGFSTWLQSSAWPAMVLIFAALGLLWSFHQVTRSGVQQSELRLQSISAYKKATWQCNSLSDQIARRNCLSQRIALASDATVRQP